MIITKLSLGRRTFMRGLGTAIALPFLDAMVPALSAAPAAPKRLGFLYVPNGMFLPNFHPAGDGGRGYELTPVLKPLEAHREDVVVVSGLSNMPVRGQRPGRRCPHPESCRLAERHAAEAHRRRQHHQREDDRSVRRRHPRRRYTAALAGADARVELPGRQLRGRLQLRLSQLHVVARAQLAAAARG